jgi:hypothetical protein
VGFLSRLFGGSSRDKEPKDEYAKVEPILYKECSIFPSALKEGSQYRVAGKIEKLVDDQRLSHRFVRSDVLSSKEDANDLMVTKAKIFIDQMNGNIFQ